MPMHDIFDSDQMVNQQYGIVRTLTQYMIRTDRKRYVDFINGVKDGMKWQDGLRKNYGVPLDTLVDAHGNSMCVMGLQPNLLDSR